MAVEVWEGNTADPQTVPAQVKKLRQRFGLKRLVLVGDRGRITSARIREDFSADSGIGWITALLASSIQKRAAAGALQLSLFDTADLAEMLIPILVVTSGRTLPEMRLQHGCCPDAALRLRICHDGWRCCSGSLYKSFT